MSSASVCSLIPRLSFLSVRSASVAVFHAGTILICFDNVRSPAVFSQSPSVITEAKKKSTNIVIYRTTSPPPHTHILCCSGSKQSCLYVLGFSEFNQPWANNGFVACELAGFCKIMGTKIKSKQMDSRVESGAALILTCFRDEGKADVIWVLEDERFIGYKCSFDQFFLS